MTLNDRPHAPNIRSKTPLDATRWSAIRRHARLWRTFVAIAIVRETQFRVNFLATLFVGVAQLIVSLVPILLLFNFTDDIHGWSQADVLVLVGLHQMMAGLLSTFIAPNMMRMTQYITHGDLDLLLIRPVNTHFLVTTRWVQPSGIFAVVSGFALVLVGLVRSGEPPAPGGIVQALVLVMAGFVLLTCAWSAIAICVFWMSSVTAGTLFFNDIMQAGRYPVQFFPAALRVFLTVAVPWAFATTFPAEALTRGVDSWLAPAAFAFAGIAIWLVNRFFSYAVRLYSSASS